MIRIWEIGGQNPHLKLPKEPYIAGAGHGLYWETSLEAFESDLVLFFKENPEYHTYINELVLKALK